LVVSQSVVSMIDTTTNSSIIFLLLAVPQSLHCCVLQSYFKQLTPSTPPTCLCFSAWCMPTPSAFPSTLLAAPRVWARTIRVPKCSLLATSAATGA
jgi:hypothetical protein